MTPSCCVIFAGSPELGVPCLPVPEDAYVLCADSGLRLAEMLHRAPDLVLGDFDSLGDVPTHLPHMTVPAEKDDTDTMLAVRVALEKGFRDIRIYGAFGGRLDHTIANLQTLEYIVQQGAEGLLASPTAYAYLQKGGTVRHYPKLEGFTLSLFAWTERCTGVWERGVYYPLTDATLTRDFPLGVSNRITAEAAEIRCDTGLLLVMGAKS